ncbi:hypothetical protein BH09PSE5_BH09PSE5_43560 [soil metagenome]
MSSIKSFKVHALAFAVVASMAGASAMAQDKPDITPERVASGAKLYAENCSVCHGPKMVEQGGGFFDLRTFPPAQKSRFFSSVSNGKNSMPPWKSVLTQEQIGDLFSYVVAGEKS